jgi:cation:H+ antiporter
MLDVAALIAGLIVLAKAADVFVEAAGGLALALRMSPVVVGAVVIGFGTSAPELLVAILAVAQGSTDVAIGNVVGSNVANVTLVAAIPALFAPLAVSSQTLRREAPMSAAAVALLAVLLQGGLTRIEGIGPVAALGVAVLVLLRAPGPDDPLGHAATAHSDPSTGGPPGRQALRTAGGLAGVLCGAQLTLSGARGIAAEVGLSEGVVGLTVVAVGTALPELATGIQAVRREQTDLFVGNLLGSNMFNSLGVGGVIALLAPGPLQDSSLAGLPTRAMVLAAGAGWVFMGTRRRLDRWEAVACLGGYLAMLALL